MQGAYGGKRLPSTEAIPLDDTVQIRVHDVNRRSAREPAGFKAVIQGSVPIAKS